MPTGTQSGSKGIKEIFGQFFETPTRERLRELLKNNLGEFAWLDFKEVWPAPNKLARHMLAMANTEGGALIIGMKERDGGTLEAAGLAEFVDKTAVKQGVQKYLPDTLDFNIYDFAYTESEYPAIKGKRFQAVLIEDRPGLLPFMSPADGESISSTAIYLRDGAESKPANHLQLQRILNRRIETMHSTRRELSLREHLDELELLYKAIRPVVTAGFEIGMAAAMRAVLERPNPDYPQESFDRFVNRMIEAKKRVIEVCVTKLSR